MRPVLHMAPFLGASLITRPHRTPGSQHQANTVNTGSTTPIFSITPHYQPHDTQDFLIRNPRLGAALAAEFAPASSSSPNYPPHNLVLMASHGFAAVARDVRLATYMGVYAVVNARVQTMAGGLQQQAAGGMGQGGGGAGEDGIVYLDERQIADSWETEMGIVEKPWGLWVREVGVEGLYVNELRG